MQERNSKGQFVKGLVPWNKGRLRSKLCEKCGNEYQPKPGKYLYSRFCSRSCANKGKQTRLGMKNSEIHRKRISESNKGRIGYSDNKNPNWKGDQAGYVALHSWVNRKLGKPQICTFCGKTDAKNYQWANISGEYKRDVNDFIRLCVSCHAIMDGRRVIRRERNYICK